MLHTKFQGNLASGSGHLRHNVTLAKYKNFFSLSARRLHMKFLNEIGPVVSEKKPFEQDLSHGQDSSPDSALFIT